MASEFLAPLSSRIIEHFKVSLGKLTLANELAVYVISGIVIAVAGVLCTSAELWEMSAITIPG